MKKTSDKNKSKSTKPAEFQGDAEAILMECDKHFLKAANSEAQDLCSALGKAIEDIQRLITTGPNMSARDSQNFGKLNSLFHTIQNDEVLWQDAQNAIAAKYRAGAARIIVAKVLDLTAEPKTSK